MGKDHEDCEECPLNCDFCGCTLRAKSHFEDWIPGGTAFTASYPCHLTPADFLLIKSLIAGEWLGETFGGSGEVLERAHPDGGVTTTCPTRNVLDAT